MQTSMQDARAGWATPTRRAEGLVDDQLGLATEGREAGHAHESDLDEATAVLAPVVPLFDRGCQRSSGPTDAELLERCRHKDGEAWALLVERYERLVYAVARRNGLSDDDAADVTQVTFLSLLESLNKIRDEARLASWLMTVARRHAWRARNHSRRDVGIDAVPERAGDPLENWDSIVALHQSLALLGNPCRELLEALYLDPEGPSYAEVARRFGRSIGGIGPLRGRCLEKLHAIFAAEEIG